MPVVGICEEQRHQVARALGPAQPLPLFFAYPDDEHSFRQAANRCVGVGKCRKHENEGGTVMCPSYQVTREEEHSTRGRARLLFEMLDGHGDGPITDGWRSEEVKEALDLCLACKGCKTDCPANVDMATYKAEFLAHHYRRPAPAARRLRHRLAARGRPRRRRPGSARRSTGSPRSPAAARGSAPGPPAWRTATDPAVRRRDRCSSWWRRRAAAGRRPHGRPRGAGCCCGPTRSPTTSTPQIGRAAVEVLEDAGWEVEIPTEPLCCGLTWISTGPARRRHAACCGGPCDVLAPHVRAGGLVVGLEPSCTAVFRSDAHRAASPTTRTSHRLRDHTVTLAELLTAAHRRLGSRRARRTTHGARAGALPPARGPGVGRRPRPARAGRRRRRAARLRLLRPGRQLRLHRRPRRGQRGARRADAAAARSAQADDDTVVLADGFSCRTQIHQLDSGGREGVHLAELLADLLRDRPPDVTSPPRGGTP